MRYWYRHKTILIVKTYAVIWIFALLAFLPGSHAFSQIRRDTIPAEITLRGQWSGWTTAGWESVAPGMRYIPQINFQIGRTTGPRALRFEAEMAGNLYAHYLWEPGTSFLETESRLYRGWVKMAGPRSELRVGLQKINFGSALMLRPLMWFDTMDPRDPLQLTEGVWGALGRYYFDNNINIWVWGLLGNDGQRPWDIGLSDEHVPEFGARLQVPAGSGSAAVTYHRRKTEMQGLYENRYGVDLRFDYVIGFWAEATWINKRGAAGALANQELFMAGADYTFGLGNGLHLTAEHMFMASGEKAFELSGGRHLTALWMDYPISLWDHLAYIFYYDWKGKGMYNFLQWKHTLAFGDLYVMAFANPDVSLLPDMGGTTSRLPGKGVRIMLVINHLTRQKSDKTIN